MLVAGVRVLTLHPASSPPPFTCAPRARGARWLRLTSDRIVTSFTSSVVHTRTHTCTDLTDARHCIHFPSFFPFSPQDWISWIIVRVLSLSSTLSVHFDGCCSLGFCCCRATAPPHYDSLLCCVFYLSVFVVVVAPFSIVDCDSCPAVVFLPFHGVEDARRPAVSLMALLRESPLFVLFAFVALFVQPLFRFLRLFLHTVWFAADVRRLVFCHSSRLWLCACHRWHCCLSRRVSLPLTY